MIQNHPLDSVKTQNIYLDKHFANRDDAGFEMIEREKSALTLLLAYQKLAKAVEPTWTRVVTYNFSKNL